MNVGVVIIRGTDIEISAQAARARAQWEQLAALLIFAAGFFGCHGAHPTLLAPADH